MASNKLARTNDDIQRVLANLLIFFFFSCKQCFFYII